jgi:hypothetical protein
LKRAGSYSSSTTSLRRNRDARSAKADHAEMEKRSRKLPKRRFPLLLEMGAAVFYLIE